MPKSNTTQRANKPTKPKKPYADYPLFPHASGRWAKKIRGQFRYFGYWGRTVNGSVAQVENVGASAQEAVDLYNEQRDDLHAGRTPHLKTDGLTVADLCNRFLTSKRRRLDNLEITDRTFHDYHSSCARIIAAFGRTHTIDGLSTDDFERLRASLATTLGPVALGNAIQRTRMVFKYAFDQGLIGKPIRYGQRFKKPSQKVLRQQRQKNGKRMFEAAELRTIIESAKQPLRAMILFGINCGFGQSDLSNLPVSAIDFELGWVDFPRPKTGIERRCPLWPETQDAAREAIENRPDAKDDMDVGRAFITKYGHRWVKINKPGTHDDAIGKEFSKLLNRLLLKRTGVSFYALRHTFETIAGESKDQVAVNAIMGHVDNSMAGAYRERISDERLLAVTDCVREWLFGDK